MSEKPSDNQTESVARAFEQPDWYVNGYVANIRVRRETVCAYTRDRAFENVLDIGCGDGSLSLPFLSSDCRVTFLDLSNAMLEIVAKKVPDSLRHQASFLKGEFTELD